MTTSFTTASYRPIAQTASMVMTIATNCSATRQRIMLLGGVRRPPRIMLMRPNRRPARRRQLDGKDEGAENRSHRRYITPCNALRHLRTAARF